VTGLERAWRLSVEGRRLLEALVQLPTHVLLQTLPALFLARRAKMAEDATRAVLATSGVEKRARLASPCVVPKTANRRRITRKRQSSLKAIIMVLPTLANFEQIIANRPNLRRGDFSIGTMGSILADIHNGFLVDEVSPTHC
jgi:hypothetical protein